ncbi:MAG: fumarate hydratase C-terminal domain-containing protein [Clostridia bacterium]|nr:fumarate hydratase C-terminal domain-containing protein [Clostridia bacterium]
MKKYSTHNYREWASEVSAGEEILLSGVVYTSRDAAHKRIFEAMKKGNELPYDIKDAFIYYAGPTPAKSGAVGSCGPTTSSRMDVYAPTLYEMGLAATVGKGDRSDDVYRAIKENGGIYLCAIGGAGALASKAIKKAEVIAYDDLGCESVKRFEIEDFPLYVAIDTQGNSIFKK